MAALKLSALLGAAAAGALLPGCWASGGAAPSGPAAPPSQAAAPGPPPQEAPPGMVWVPGGRFSMGTDDERSMPNEWPAHPVQVDGIFFDEHDVTNAEFRRFVEATGYVTTAERKPEWE